MAGIEDIGRKPTQEERDSLRAKFTTPPYSFFDGPSSKRIRPWDECYTNWTGSITGEKIAQLDERIALLNEKAAKKQSLKP